MSTLIDVGDALELTFSTAPGADVIMSWLDRQQNPVIDGAAVAEAPPGSGKFPVSLVASSAGMWTALFTASGAAIAVEPYYVRAVAIPAQPPLASVGDVVSLYGTLSAAKEQQASALLRAASTLVRSRFPVDAGIAAGRLAEDVVALGVSHMVIRVLRNPKGVRSETIGPFSRTFVDAGLLVITAAEEAMFTAAPASSWVMPGSVRMTPSLMPSNTRRCGWNSCGW